MGDTRLYTRAGRRSIISASDLLSKVGEYVFVCVPVAAMEIARKMVRNRGYWRTSYASDYGDDSYTLPGDDDFEVIKAFLDEFLEATTDMDCTDFANELDDIEQAIKALSLGGGCGCGSGGAGATSPPVDDTDTGDITEPTGTPPPGYPDWATYQIQKCDVATMVVSDLLADLVWWQNVTIATLTISGLSAGMLSILSAFTLTAILAGLLALLAYNITFLLNAETAIEDGFSDIVCAIMSGTTSQTSMNNFISEMEDKIDLEITDPIARFLVKQLLGQWADAELFNLLYADYDDVQARQIPTGGDCTACGGLCTNFVTEIGTWEGGLTFSSDFVGGFDQISVIWNATFDACSDLCGPSENHSLEGIIDWLDPNPLDADSFRIWGDDDCPTQWNNASVYSSDTQMPLGEIFCGRKFAVISGQPFSITLERYGQCV